MNLVELLNSLPNIVETTEQTRQFRVLDHIRFEDNENTYSISVQASIFHYCTPRDTLPFEEYTHFEVMLAIPENDIPIEWGQFDCGGDNVFGYVPKQMIEQLIANLTDKYK